MGVERCWYTGKMMLTKKKARWYRFMINKQAEKEGTKKIKAYYLCEHCETYHISSMHPITYSKMSEWKEKNIQKPSIKIQVVDRLKYLEERTKSKRRNEK